MVKISLNYGTKKMVAEIPEKNYSGTLEVNEPQGVKDPAADILQCLRNPIDYQPLDRLIKNEDNIAIIVDDHTRPAPTKIILPPILEELKRSGISKNNVNIIFGCGTHRKVKEQEAKNLLGENIAEEIQWTNHDCEAEDLVYLGTTSRGTRVELNPLVVKADLKILTGDICYHFFAGYGGGRKSIMPGVASKETVTKNHCMLTHPKSEIGVLEGNPIHEDMVEGAKLAKPDIIVNVVQNTRKEIIKTFCGDLESAFYEGVRFLDSVYRVKSDKADIVIVSAGGYPKDINLYQAYKAIHNALPVVKNNGAIIFVAECREHTGHEVFQEWMEKYSTAEEMKKQLVENFVMGAHKAYYLAKALQKAKIYMITEIPPKKLEKVYKIIPVKSIEEALEDTFNTMKKDPKIKVIPHGSAILPC
ncbi:MAG: nickel-dependent lactate racemase [Candidatus Jordarchaeum sp.]|uniref:nickel-dependent lactate racemase n=1 Tax=Candidatus Jordarchaeum sp. TaxID=2823881 RepID=UPI00404AF9FA